MASGSPLLASILSQQQILSLGMGQVGLDAELTPRSNLQPMKVELGGKCPSLPAFGGTILRATISHRVHIRIELQQSQKTPFINAPFIGIFSFPASPHLSLPVLPGITSQINYTHRSPSHRLWGNPDKENIF